MKDINRHLNGIRVAVPESRQLTTMVNLLERRGAKVFRVPLVAIHDSPDSEPVHAWIKRFVVSPPELFIILTGEGVRRLLEFASRHDLKDDLVGALKQTRLLCRGPKPDRALREVGLKGHIQASAPTTAGVIQTLQGLAIERSRIAIQLYGQDPNTTLMQYLAQRQVKADTVSPYVYADETEESRVLELIEALASGEIEVIAFTSKPQLRRLQQVAKKHGLLPVLYAGLASSCVAAVGPVVQEELQLWGIRVDIMPTRAFFMKPLVTEIIKYFRSRDSGS